MTLGIDGLGVLLAVSAIYNVAVVVVARRFRRRARFPRPADVAEPPGVSVLVPLDGVEPMLFENLAAYCELDYSGPVQLVVGSLDADDRALVTAQQVADRYPTADVQIVAGAATLGPNRKASLLAALSRHARHPIIAALDSDVRVAPDYLRALLPVLARPGVGLVSCLYRAPRSDTLAKAYEALCINTDFCPSVMLASVLGRRDIALGASVVLRKSTLHRLGGFTAVVDYLADDHRIAELVNAVGERVALAPYVVESDPNPATLAGALRHQVRWARTVRACAPWGYVGNVVTHGTSFALCALALSPVLPATVVLLAAAVIPLRLAAALAGARALGTRLGWTMLLVPARDVAATLIWFATFVGNRIEWRGRYYRIGPEGHLREATPPANARPAPAFGTAPVSVHSTSETIASR